MVKRIKVGPGMLFSTYLGLDNFCADDKARTHVDFGEANGMIKSYIFSTQPSICRRKSLKNSTKPRNTLPPV